MDHLWSPWRYSYISRSESASGCVLCEIPRSGDDAAAFLIHRGLHNYVVLNRFPYTTGHLMVVPYEHVETLEAVKLFAGEDYEMPVMHPDARRLLTHFSERSRHYKIVPLN